MNPALAVYLSRLEHRPDTPRWVSSPSGHEQVEQQIDVPLSLKSINLDEEENHMGSKETQAVHIATAQDVIVG